MNLFSIFKKDLETVSPRRKEYIDTSFYSTKQKVLPDNFAQDLMDLEMKLECSEVSQLADVQRMSDLYRLAIEYYILEDQQKAGHFQKKLMRMLASPKTLMAFENKNGKCNEEKGKRDKEAYKTEKSFLLKQFNSQSDIVLKNLLVGAEQNQKRKSLLIAQNIDRQEDYVRKRLEVRSKSRAGHTKTHTNTHTNIFA